MTTNVNAAADSSQVETGGKNEPPPPPAPPSPATHGGSKVYKTGPLFLSSKGIGWTSWKKRWFILTQTSLVFYRSDPNVAPQKGGEVNLTLGGIDLNSSGSVVVKEDKKLLTVLFTDGRDGRAFTLKAETLEDLHEWKVALEEALSNAPNAASLVGQNGVLKNDQTSSANTPSEQLKDRQTAKSLVIGRPILLALEDIDGTPSFLEKALRFLEDYGVKTEGILRQAADVEDVERRIQEYEKGKTDFSPEEDSHVIADCVKYVLRELPSSPVPASCCKALLEACRTERSMRVNAMRSAICETFPEPNRRLLQRILDMMQTVALNKTVNRMSISAVAACMAPLLLRPLLAGDCDLDNGFDMAGDGSVQLMQAAAAANHAQAIVITLLEEYDKIFGDGAVTHEPYTDSEESGSESEEITEDDDSFDEDDMTEESESEVDEDFDHESSPTSTETGEIQDNKKVSEGPLSNTPQVDGVLESSKNLSSGPPHETSSLQHDSVQVSDSVKNLDEPKTQSNPSPETSAVPKPSEKLGADSVETSAVPKPSEKLYGHFRSARRPNILGRTPAKKNLSMESIEIHFEDEAEIQKLEGTITDSETTTPDEASASSVLQDCLKKQKNQLHERRLSLEKDVASLQEQIQKEMDLRTALEAGLKVLKLPHSVSSLDDKMKAELAEIALAEADVMNLKQKADDLEFQLIQQRDQNSRIGQDIGNQIQQNPNNQFNSKEKQVDGGVLAAPSPSENVSRSKHESSLDKPEGEKDKKQESGSSPHKPLPLNQQTEAALNQKTYSRKSSRGEGSNSALSKLTNRLNFLKERRSQNASDSQTLDKGRNSDENSDKHQDSKGQSYKHQDSKGQSYKHQDSKGHSSKHQDSKGQSSEMDNNESRHNANGQFQQNVDNKGKSEGHQRGKSGGHSPVEKGHSKFPPRTFSR